MPMLWPRNPAISTYPSEISSYIPKEKQQQQQNPCTRISRAALFMIAPGVCCGQLAEAHKEFYELIVKPCNLKLATVKALTPGELAKAANQCVSVLLLPDLGQFTSTPLNSSKMEAIQVSWN